MLARYDENGNDNGRITCKEARRHGISPLHRSHPAYRHMRTATAMESSANGQIKLTWR